MVTVWVGMCSHFCVVIPVGPQGSPLSLLTMFLNISVCRIRRLGLRFCVHDANG